MGKRVATPETIGKAVDEYRDVKGSRQWSGLLARKCARWRSAKRNVPNNCRLTR